MTGASLEERFWEKVEVRGPDECWEWRASTWRKGYGKIRTGGTGTPWIGAHRAAWILANGRPIPDGLFVLHRCDNPPCCNPRHLFLGTNLDNVRDRDAKGRGNYLTRRGALNGNAKLSGEDAVDIRAANADGARATDLAEQYGVHPATIWRVLQGVRYVEEVVPHSG